MSQAMRAKHDPPDEHHLVDFVETAAIGLHRVASDGTILWANRSDYEPLGYSAEEYIGHNITEFHADADAIGDMLCRLSAGERLLDYEARLRCKDGSIRTVMITSSVLFDDAGNFVHTRCFTRDITEKKRIEEALRRALEERARLLEQAEEAVRARDVFLAVAAHELKTPLTPLRLQVEQILRTVQRGSAERLSVERMASKLGLAARQVGRLEHLVNNLLDVSRLASGRIELTYEDRDLVAIAQGTVEQHRAACEEAETPLVLAPHAPIEGRWELRRIEQILQNLLANAVKYGQGKPVEITLGADATRARFTVRDHGPGIAPEDQARVFEQFERAASARHYGGLGLGLWIVRRLVEAMGGEISLVCEPGAGAAFTVELPRRPLEAAGG
jgi:PAS domain S-box-containing protein